MFASHEVVLDAWYDVACARLVHLIDWGTLHTVSEVAYDRGLDALFCVGPLGQTRGLSKLVRVQVLEPVRRGPTTTVSLRWEATGLAGDLFPVLDADLTLMRQSEGRSRLALVGSYRPPLGRAGAVLDRVVMSRVATATIRFLLDKMAAAIADPAPYSLPAGRITAPDWRSVTQPILS